MSALSPYLEGFLWMLGVEVSGFNWLIGWLRDFVGIGGMGSLIYA